MICHYSSQNIKPIGRIWIAQSKKGVCAISFNSSEKIFLDYLKKVLPEYVLIKKPLLNTFKRIDRYTGSKSIDLDLPFFFASGTKFQKRIWNEIKKIPYGKTISYAELAKRAGHLRAFRAAANACGKNPIPIIIPCHRVIASNGSIGGFSSGVDIKRKLLNCEKLKK